MAFRFPLAALLRFRQVQERQQETLLQEANFHAAGLRRMIAAAETAAEAMKAHDIAELKTGVRAAELQFDLLRLSVLADRRRRLESELAQAEEVCVLRRQALQHARQQREIVDTLRSRQLHSYEESEKRHEQRRLDDLFLLRREFLRRG